MNNRSLFVNDSLNDRQTFPEVQMLATRVLKQSFFEFHALPITY